MDIDFQNPKVTVISGIVVIVIGVFGYIPISNYKNDYVDKTNAEYESSLNNKTINIDNKSNPIDLKFQNSATNINESNSQDANYSIANDFNYDNNYRYPNPAPVTNYYDYSQEIQELDRQQTENDLINLCRKYILGMLSINNINPMGFCLSSYVWHHEGNIAWVEIKGNYNGYPHRYAFEIHLNGDTYKIIYCQEVPPI